MLIYNAVVHPMDAPTLPTGFVEWAEGKSSGGPHAPMPPAVGDRPGRPGRPSAPGLYRRPLPSGDAGGRPELR